MYLQTDLRQICSIVGEKKLILDYNLQVFVTCMYLTRAPCTDDKQEMKRLDMREKLPALYSDQMAAGQMSDV